VYCVICLKYTNFNDYNKVKSSTVTAGMTVTNMIKVHRVMKKLLRGNLTKDIKVYNHVCNKI